MFLQRPPGKGEVQLQPEQVRCHGFGTGRQPGVQVRPPAEPQFEQRHPVQLQAAAGRFLIYFIKKCFIDKDNYSIFIYQFLLKKNIKFH